MSYPRYERYRDVSGQWRFRLRDTNYKTILHSSEGYHNQADCTRAIEICQRNSPYDSNYVRRTTTAGLFYFTLQSDNGRDIGMSEGYNTQSARELGIANVKRDGSARTIVDVLV
jgi:uncharacterized protein YegP (UPF0339 family)